MDINEILSPEPRRRTKTVRIDGLPDLILTELMAGERWDMAESMPEDDPDASNKFVAKTVLRSLLEFKRDPTDAELEKFMRTYGLDVIDLLYTSLLNFSAIDTNAVEDAKKP